MEVPSVESKMSRTDGYTHEARMCLPLCVKDVTEGARIWKLLTLPSFQGR